MNKRKEQAKAKKQMEWEQEDKKVRERWSKAPEIKTFLRSNGCDLPFYDLLDSYEVEFLRIVDWAKRRYPTLRGVHEIEGTRYFKTTWEELGYSDLSRIKLDLGNSASDYDTSVDGNLNGATAAFRNSGMSVITGVKISKSVKGSANHREAKYASKIMVLCHELGHVHDIENEINFNLISGEVDIIEAEVFANLFALDLMASRQIVFSFDSLMRVLENDKHRRGYLGEVSQEVLKRVPQHNIIRWTELSKGPDSAEEA